MLENDNPGTTNLISGNDVFESKESQVSAFMQDLITGSNSFQKKVETLKNLDMFVLDNSMRETTIAALRGLTLENKRKIHEEVKKCGFKYYIVESFNQQMRVGEPFLKELNDKGEDLSCAFCFSEIWEKIENKVPQPDLPIGLVKCKEYNIKNVFLELDLNSYQIDYEKFNMNELCKYTMKRVEYIREIFSEDSLILINMRDFSTTMQMYPERVYQFTHFFSSLPKEQRILGLTFEDLGMTLPQELGLWTRCVRDEMIRCGWEDGQLLHHQHEQWNDCSATTLEVLASGATGMWAAVCMEGAGMGHADTCTAIMNLIRLGNEKVLKRYNCKYLREAAINVTKEVTGFPPHERQPIYGKRSLDLVFGFIFSDPSAHGGFNMAEFLGLEKEVRITNMCNPDMILIKLKQWFGENKQFTVEMAKKMQDTMLKHAVNNRKEEYNSRVGLAMLFDQSDGKMTEEMSAIVQQNTECSRVINGLIDEVKAMWDEFDPQKTEKLSFRHFYDRFMGRYFGCYTCEDSQMALKAIDMDDDEGVDWWEFRHYLLWAGRQYPFVKDVEELMDIAFTKGIMPAMLDTIDEENAKTYRKVQMARSQRGIFSTSQMNV